MKSGYLSRVLAVASLSAVLGGASFAGPTWICSIVSATACQEDGTTGQPDLGGLARPTFLRVDVEAKQVTILAPAERRGEVSKIDTVQQVDKMWVLTGVEHGRVWCLLITADGRMTLSATDDGEVWSVFGFAIREEDLKPTADGKGDGSKAK